MQQQQKQQQQVVYNKRYYIGTLVPNWLEIKMKEYYLWVLLEIFRLHKKMIKLKKYGAMFFNEIKELNDEDGKRNASGGNLQVNFNGRGLI